MKCRYHILYRIIRFEKEIPNGCAYARGKDLFSLRIELCNYGNDAQNFDFASLYDFVDIGD